MESTHSSSHHATEKQTLLEALIGTLALLKADKSQEEARAQKSAGIALRRSLCDAEGLVRAPQDLIKILSHWSHIETGRRLEGLELMISAVESEIQGCRISLEYDARQRERSAPARESNPAA